MKQMLRGSSLVREPEAPANHKSAIHGKVECFDIFGDGGDGSSCEPDRPDGPGLADDANASMLHRKSVERMCDLHRCMTANAKHHQRSARGDAGAAVALL